MSAHLNDVLLWPKAAPTVPIQYAGAPQLALLILAALVVYAVTVGIYNVYFHPLRHFPGPFWHAATPIPYIFGLLRGDSVIRVLELHNKYGPVVRLTPVDLSFNHPDAWKDIYGHRIGANSGLEEPSKAPLLYRLPGDPPTIISENRANHALLRKQLSHGFSERSMRAQEPIIGGYVDQLIAQLRKHSAGGQPQPMTAWYNRTTFDVIGDLAFGEPFDLVKNAENDPMAGAIMTSSWLTTVYLSLRYLGAADWLVFWLKRSFTPKDDFAPTAARKLKRRAQLAQGRDDLIEGLLSKQKDWNMQSEHVEHNAGILLLAGSETTASLLSAATYLLLRNPEAMRKVLHEVRTTFKTESEINMTSAANLPYMLAVLNESLRRFPPVALGLPRLVPKGGTVVLGQNIPEGTQVACWQWALNHSEDNFEDPFAFKPERWLENSREGKGDRLDAVQPFHVGPRNCIGKNLAIAEMRLILARVLFAFDLELDESADGEWMDQKVFIFWQKKPLPVRLTARS